MVDAYKIWHIHYQQFPRLSKFSLGSKIDLLFTDTVEYILIAGYSSVGQKHPFILKANNKLDLLKFFLRIAWDVRCLDQKQFAALATPLNEIGKDLRNWEKSVQTKKPYP